MKERARSKSASRKKRTKKEEPSPTAVMPQIITGPTNKPANRPYFGEPTFPAPSRVRHNMLQPMFSPSELSFGTTGIVFRDAESSRRALAEIAQKRRERLERQRAAGLLLSLLALALTVHFVTTIDWSPQLNGGAGKYKVAAKYRVYNAPDQKINYGRNNEEEDGLQDVVAGGSASPSNLTSLKANVLNNFANYDEDMSHDLIPFFFHAPRGGGQTVKEIAGTCLGKVQASEVGVREGHDQDETLQKVTIEDGSYVNVDTTSIPGLERAASLGLASSNVTDVITSSYFFKAGQLLFSPEHQGRAFVVLRDPIGRAVSTYYYQQTLGVIDPSVTLEAYAQGHGIENNWVVRFLTNTMEGELKKHHLDQAKRILSKKFLVGFLDDTEESIERMMNYFGWKYDEDDTNEMIQRDCVQKRLMEGTNRNPVEYELPKRGSQAHALIAWQTQFDTKLYDFAKALFGIQTKQYGSKQRKKELKKKEKDKTNVKS